MKLNQHDTVCRLMFVTLDISINAAGEGLQERLQIRILFFFAKRNCLELKYSTFCCLRDNYPLLWWFPFGEWYLAKDWAQIWSKVLAIMASISRYFMQLNEPQCLEPAFNGWPLFKAILFRKDIFNLQEP